ncbi:dihydropteroate synthase [Methanoregula sp.]|uniref:dihydropteroate synthase n=1 Tax=Methanoregula sp. TaxID=2052170 RepID=UPI000CC27653|nr:dihydropteroate synthase [Methanoregula sp.]PKG31912.1 MAG: dihydropteroate synthase [Methanoregula sp.]
MRSCTVNKLVIGGDAPPRIMGVLNVSPESFYHDSYIPTNEIHRKAVEMIEQGADMLDVGARSTAPNAQAISGTEEGNRIDAALKELDGTGFTISVDTMNPWVLDVCLKHEVHAVNDIAGFASDAYARRVAEAGLPAFLMATDYTPGDAVGLEETKALLATIVKRCETAGVDNYVLDPGVGIWTPQRSYDDNWELCRHFDEFLAFDRPLLGAISRKSFIGDLVKREPEDRLPGSLAVTVFLLQKGASVIRTHDVKETFDTIKVCQRMGKQV